MPFKLAVRNGDYENAPEGTVQAVVVDVIDLGMRPNKFKPGESVQKAQVAFQTEDETSAGSPFVVRSFPMTASMDRKANLRKLIETINGSIKDEDLDAEGEFDIESIIGRNCLVTIEHSPEKEGKIYANVVAVGALPKSMKTKLESRDYTRVQDRDEISFDTEQLETADEKALAKF
jgi:hypothetical protein